jgi:dihydrofolate reductase
MRKIVSGFAASLDGYIEGPKGEIDWILIDKEIDFAEQMKRFDTYLFGRKTYETMLPSMATNPAPGALNYVFSKTLQSVQGNFILCKEDIGKKVAELKNAKGKDIAVFGGAVLLASLLDLKLVDEISICYIPVLLGKGKPMVDVLSDKVWLSLTKTKTYQNGSVQVYYDVRYSS